jgi:ABC-type branched-subunit amino acid transport system permease subunit
MRFFNRNSLNVLTKKKLMLLFLSALFILPLASPSRFYMVLFSEVLIWALLALSYDLALGYTGLVGFGHAALFGVGAYAAALLLRMDYSFFLAIPAAMLFGGLIGAVYGVFTRRVGGIYYALVTLAFSEVIFLVFSKLVDLSGGETGISVPRPDFLRSDVILYFAIAVSVFVVIVLLVTVVKDLRGGTGPRRSRIIYLALAIAFLGVLFLVIPSKLSLDRTTITTMNIYYFLALIPLFLCYIVASRIVNSPVGHIFVAIRENEERTKMLGYNVFNYKMLSSAISGIFAGLAGALYAPFILSINPSSVLGSTITINVLLYSILGGLGTLIGPMIGAGIITILADELTGVPYIGQYWMLVLGVFYLLVILFLPYGIVNTLRFKGTSFRQTLKKLASSIRPSGNRKTDK